MPADAASFFPLLKTVSRSFYLTLRVLPGGVRSQIGLAYLLARATDTIADTSLIPIAQRLAALQELRGRILGTRAVPVDFAILAAAQESPVAREGTPGANPERLLLEQIEDVVAVLEGFSAGDLGRIRAVLAVITSGQELDLQRFGSASPTEVRALSSDTELDDYTYRVAGCVGEFWTKMCRAHVFPTAALDDAFLLENGQRFGKGLQLVNILRDIPRDLRAGRCYLPQPELAALGLAPHDLLDSRAELQVRPLYERYLLRAEEHLAAGWRYTNALPRSAVRVRLACAWPVLLGVRTLAQLRRGPFLDPAQRIKVSRADVRRTLVSTILRYPMKVSWQSLFDEARM